MNLSNHLPDDVAVISTAGMSREDWLDHRTTGIGGSEAAALIGVSPFRSAGDVWLDKLGMAEPVRQTEAMRRGQLVEPAAAIRFSEVTGLRVDDAHAMLITNRYGFPMIANVDRVAWIADVPAVLELKDVVSPHSAAHWQRDGEDIVPAYYQSQVDHYLAVTGWGFGIVAGWVMGRYVVIYVPRDEERINAIIEAERTFWTVNIEGAVIPTITDPKHQERFLDGLYAPENAEEEDDAIELSADIAAFCVSYQRAVEAERQAKAEKQAAANAIKAALGNYQVGICGGFTVTWKPTTRKGYTVEDKTFRALRVKLATINHEEDK